MSTTNMTYDLEIIQRTCSQALQAQTRGTYVWIFGKSGVDAAKLAQALG